MRLKVCGMKFNTEEVAKLQPDYLGFIFWEPSARFFDTDLPQLPPTIRKVGVFVDAPGKEIIEKVEKYSLHAVQLHGKESPELCEELKSTVPNLELIKVFSVKDTFDFSNLKPFETSCDYFMFDTKGDLPGGNSQTFDWSVLKNYPSKKPFFLSGGIGPKETQKVIDFFGSPASAHCHAIDVNSMFEVEPGLKDVEKLKEFKKILNE